MADRLRNADLLVCRNTACILNGFVWVLGGILLLIDIEGRFRAASPEEASLDDPVVLDSWGRWMEATAVELHHIRQAHTRYPILHYFWTRNPGQALSLQLRKLVSLYEGDDPLAKRPGADRLMSHPGPRSMELAVKDYVNDVLARFVDPRGKGEGGDLRSSLSKLNRYMRYE